MCVFKKEKCAQTLNYYTTSKPDAAEKEPLTLEKDKKDQSKYCLNYPKPPVLDMKWENRGINVVEWANITKFPPLLNGD